MNKIYNRFTSEIIIEGKGSVKKLVEKNYADLRNANLGNANLRIFCANNLCQHHVHVSYQIYHQGYMTLDTGEQVSHYLYRRINGEDIEVLMFCEVCKNAIDMTERR